MFPQALFLAIAIGQPSDRRFDILAQPVAVRDRRIDGLIHHNDQPIYLCITKYSNVAVGSG